MTIGQAIVLGIVQGLTEFIPVSSTGHLAIIPHFLGWQGPNLSFDVLLHLGTLCASVTYFRSDIKEIIMGFFRSPVKVTEQGWSPLTLIIATIATGIIALLLRSPVERILTEPRWAGFFLIITAALLAGSEAVSRQEKRLAGLNILDSLIIGIFQGIAVLPGISRSGATIAAGVFRKIDRADAARFSFVLAMPAILLSLALEVPDLMKDSLQMPGVLAAGFMTSALSGYFAIHWLISFLKRRRLYVFAGYCVILGVIVMVVG